MWTSTISDTEYGTQNKVTPMAMPPTYETYDEDTLTVTTGPTLSTLIDQDVNENHNGGSPSQSSIIDSPILSSQPDLIHFETEMLNETSIATCRNTYFMDGGNRFISLPELGNANTKTATHLSRIFEEWLQNKLYHQSKHDLMVDRLPILEDSLDLLGEDILNKIKSRSSVRGLIGVSKIMIKIRMGHVYCFNQLIEQDNNDHSSPSTTAPIITSDMMVLFQQFPLCIENTIYISTKSHSSNNLLNDVMDDACTIPVLLTIENVSTNSSDPYYMFENISLLV
ncbi:unnamed protein product [Cunninghamella blakesleeana]